MKAKLLKKLRKIGRNQIHIYSITRTDRLITGVSFGYNDIKYAGLFSLGESEEDVLKKAETIYITDYLLNLKNKE